MSGICELVVGRGQDVKAAIEAFVLEKGWQSAYISGAVGSVTDMRFTAPVDDSFPPNVTVTPVAGPGEILAFNGEVMVREKMDPALQKIYKDCGPLFVHIHASAATAGCHVYGGGLQGCKAFRSLKVYLQEV